MIISSDMQKEMYPCKKARVMKLIFTAKSLTYFGHLCMDITLLTITFTLQKREIFYLH